MSSKRRSYDTDEITLRKVFAKSFENNANIGGMRVLTADGQGGTYWAVPSTLGYNPSFNQINTSVANFTADLSYNIFTLNSGSGIGFSEGSGSNELFVYGKAFNQIDVSGNNTLYGFTDNVVTPAVKLAGEGGLTIRSNPQTNTIFFDMPGIQVSSSLYSFQKIQVYSNASTLTDNLSNLNSIILNAESPSTTLGLIGVNDIRLFTNATSNLVYIDLKQSTGSISTLSGLYSNLSTTILNATVTSTVRGLGTAGYVSSTQLFSTVAGLGSAGYVSSTQLFSTVAGLGSVGYVSSTQLFSTVAGLGSVGYVSSTQLFSTVAGLGSAGYISSLSTFNLSTTNLFTSTITFMDINNSQGQILAVSSGILTLNGQGIQGGGGSGSGDVTSNNLVSTVVGLGTAGYISSTQLTSTLEGLGSYGYISSTQLTSTLEGLGSYGYISSTQLTSTLEGLGSYGYISSTQLTSTLEGLGSYGYISSTQLTSTMDGLSNIAVTRLIAGTNVTLTANVGEITISASGGGGGGITDAQLVSTVVNLGTAGYISSSQLTSTVIGLGTAGYISSLQLLSTVEGLGSLGYISSPQLASTVAGLGSLGYISSLQLLSTVEGLGTTGYISTSQITSTVAGLGTTGYISTSQITSTVAGLGTAGYISSLSTMILSTGQLVGGIAEISTVNFKDAGNGNKYILASSNAVLYFNGSVVGSGSVINNFNTSTYIYQVSSVSTIFTNADFTNISSATNVYLSPRFISTQFLSAGTVQTSSIEFIDTVNSIRQLLAVNSGVLQLNQIPIVTTPNLASTVTGLGSAGYISSASLLGLVSTQNLLGLVSTQNLLGLVSTQNLLGIVSTQNLLGIVSTSYLASQLTSTIIGLGSAGYISSANLLGLVSTPNLLNLVSTQNLLNLVSTQNLLNLVSTQNLLGLVSTQNLLNHVSTANLVGLVSTQNLLGLVSTSYLASQLTSTIIGLGTAGYVSTANLLGLVSTQNLLGLVSTQNLLELVSTPNLLGLISSPNLLSTMAGLSNIAVTSLIAGTNITLTANVGDITISASGGGGGGITTADLVSTVQDLGTAGYISSLSLVSSTQNWSFYPAINNLLLSTTLFPSKIINDAADIGQPLFFQTEIAEFKDKFYTPATLLLGAASFGVSSSSEAYLVGNSPQVTGSVSSLALGYFDGNSLTTGSFYISSLYLGNFGGTTQGDLTTDNTATNLYWKGTQLNGGGGGGITTGNLVSTTSGLQTDYVGLQGYFSTLFINLTPSSAPAWNSNFPIAGGDPEPNPLVFDIFGSARILKNLYVGSTTTVIGTTGIWASTVSTTVTTARQLNFSSLFVNNTPIIVDSNGNLIANSQIF